MHGRITYANPNKKNLPVENGQRKVIARDFTLKVNSKSHLVLSCFKLIGKKCDSRNPSQENQYEEQNGNILIVLTLAIHII